MHKNMLVACLFKTDSTTLAIWMYYTHGIGKLNLDKGTESVTAKLGTTKTDQEAHILPDYKICLKAAWQ